MKKITIFTTLLLCSIFSFAQPQNYVFTVTNGVNYQKLTSPTIITTIDWDDFTADVPLGFKFHFLGDSTDTFHFDGGDMNSGTDMQFSTTSLSSNPFNVVTLLMDLVDMHLADASRTSTVGYKTDIVSGKKITKIEWNNAGFYDDSTGVDTLNAQCWVYEAEDAIELRFGNSSRKEITELMSDPNLFGLKGPFIGFIKSLDINTIASDWVYYVSNLNTPKVDSTDLTTLINNPSSIGVDSLPKANTLLRWSKSYPSGTNTTQLNDNISVYPTLVSSDFNIHFNNNFNYELTICNSNGSPIFKKKMNASNEKVDMNSFASGNYFIIFNNENQKIVYQISKL